jgi:hypothetical protein
LGGEGEVGVAQVDAGLFDEGFRAPALAVGGGEDADFAVVSLRSPPATWRIPSRKVTNQRPSKRMRSPEGAVRGFAPDALDGEEAGGGGVSGARRE